MIKVCAHYCGTIILLKECETETEANEFMKHPVVLAYEDEIESADEDELIYPDEMFIGDNEIPFCEPPKVWEMEDELPF